MLTPDGTRPGAAGQGQRPSTQERRRVLFADYFQVHLADDGVPGELSWSAQDLRRWLALSDGLVGLRTARNMEVPVVLRITAAAPSAGPADGWDVVVEADLLCRSGRLVLLGCSDHYPDAARFPVPAGWYRVRASARGIGTLSEDGLDGDDEYLLEVWPASPQGVRVLRVPAVDAGG